jgi:hypothetical protein
MDEAPDLSRIIGSDESDPKTARYRARVAAALKARGRAPDVEPKNVSPLLLVVFAVSAGLAIAGIVWIFMSSGPVMGVGGFVASGGPYAIEHQAEDWIWLPTLGAPLMMFAIVANFFTAAALDRPAGASMLVFWTAIFGPMSFQFFKYGINAPGGGRSWAWIICGVLFAAFSIPSAVMLLMRDTWRGFNGAYAWANAIGAAVGLAGGLWVWGIVAG